MGRTRHALGTALSALAAVVLTLPTIAVGWQVRALRPPIGLASASATGMPARQLLDPWVPRVAAPVRNESHPVLSEKINAATVGALGMSSRSGAGSRSVANSRPRARQGRRSGADSLIASIASSGPFPLFGTGHEPTSIKAVPESQGETTNIGQPIVPGAELGALSAAIITSVG